MMRHVPDGVLLLPFMLTQDEATVDGNQRRTLHPVYASIGVVRAQQRNEKWARVLLGYIPKPHATSKPEGLSDSAWKEECRRIFRASMNEILAPIRMYARTGVRMLVPGTDGALASKIVVPVIAFCSFDNPECKKVTGVKDGHRAMHMFCSRSAQC